MIQKILSKKIFKDAAWYTIANIVIQVSSLVGVLFVSRYLGPTNLGLYSFVQNLVAVFVTILSSMDIYANWHIVQSSNFYYELVKYTKQKAVLTSGVLVLFVVFNILTLPKDVFLLSLLLIVPIVSNVFASFVFVLQHENKTKFIASAMIVSALVILGLKVAAVLAQQPLGVFVAINSLDGIILILLSTVYLYKREDKGEKYKIQIGDFKQLFSASIFPFLYMVTWLAVVRVDQFFIPVYFNAYTLGVYAAAVKVIEMTNVLVVIMQSLIIPRVAQLQHPDKNLSKTHISIYLYGVFGFLSAGAIYILAPFIVPVLFGSSYQETVQILQVYAWSIPGLFISYLFAVIAMSKKSYKEMAFISSSVAVLAVVLSFFAARSGNILLVASVSVIVYTAAALISYIRWRKGFL